MRDCENGSYQQTCVMVYKKKCEGQRLALAFSNLDFLLTPKINKIYGFKGQFRVNSEATRF